MTSREEAARMSKTGKQANAGRPKAKLGLPDLDHSRSAKAFARRSRSEGYKHALDEFIEWYCPEPRLSFNKTVPVCIARVAPAASLVFMICATRQRSID